MLSYTYQLADRVGGRTEQQDAAGAFPTRYGLLVLVCDGMGGARGGSTASRLAVDLIQRGVQQSTDPDGGLALLQAIRQANWEIHQRSQQDPDLRGMGTTVAALLLQETHATLAHAGDSRIYQLHKGKVAFRTTDHSKVFELVKRGILSEEQARLSEDSNVILRALGIKTDVEVELHDRLAYQRGDRFLLCTDGISGAVPEEVFLGWLDGNEPVETLAPRLVQQVDEYGFRSGGGHDNLTAALVECRSSSKAAKPPGNDSAGWPGARAAGFALGALLAVAVGLLLYGQFVQKPRQAGENDRLKTENQRLRRANHALTLERDSLGQVLNHPLVQQAARQAFRQKKPSGSGLKPTPSPALKPPVSPPRSDSGAKTRPTGRPGTLASPEPVRTPETL